MSAGRPPIQIRVRLADIPRHYKTLGFALEQFADAAAYRDAAASDDPEQLVRVYAVERPFELLEAYVIELAVLGLAAAGLQSSGDEPTGRRALLLLADNDVVSASLAHRLIRVHELRNQLVLEYPDLKAGQPYVAAREFLPLLQRFVRRYLVWLKKLGYAVPVPYPAQRAS